MSTETNWQTTRPTIRERTKFMFNNDRLSDVKFVVQNSESESKQVIPAHKFVLSIGSPVFEAMLYGELAETRDSIELPDCEYESLLELFRYMYSDEVDLSGSNVMGVLYLAKKYIVPSLADKCTDYLKDKLDPSNVFSILPNAQKYEEKSLVDRCWKVIENQTEAAVKSDAFETIERSLLEAVVSRETLTIAEVELFKAVNLWATKQCQKQGLAADGEMKRRILGEEIIKAIRFPVMKEEEFAGVVLDEKILNQDEMVILLNFFNLKLTSPTGFPESQRRTSVIHRCERFSAISVLAEFGNDRVKQLIGFAVNKDIALHGLCLFGSENNSYIVTLEVKDTSNNLTLVSISGTYSSKVLKCRNISYHGFEVLFDSAAVLKKNKKYQIEALISGPDSKCGFIGRSPVDVSGVTFTFLTVHRNRTSTCTYEGQFPEFLFSV